MASQHTKLLKQIIARYNRPGINCWLNPVGYDPRARIHYGLAEGSLDIVACQAVIITPDMVGQTFGRFHNWDGKTGDDYLKEKQLWFAETVARLGGIAGEVRDLDDVEYLLNKGRNLCP